MKPGSPATPEHGDVAPEPDADDKKSDERLPKHG